MHGLLKSTCPLHAIPTGRYPPNSNMEYGIIISDENQFSDFKQNYWDQLWKYSQQSAISGGALAGCYFK